MKLKQLFLSAAIVTSLSLSLLSSPLIAHEHKGKADKVQDHQIGLQLYSLRNYLDDTDDAVKYIKDWGIKVAEGGGNLHGNSIGDFKAILDKHNVSIVSVDTSIEEIRDNAMGAAFKAKYFGAKYATIYWVPHDFEVGFTIEDAKRLVDILNTGGKMLKEHGITLQYHPHGYEFLAYKDGTMLDYIIQNTTEAKFQMDVFWIKQGGADPLAVLKKYAGRFTSLHLKDRLPGSKDTANGSADVETNVVLGTGDVGIAALVKEAKKQGIEYFFIEDESSRVLTQVPKSHAYIKALLD